MSNTLATLRLWVSAAVLCYRYVFLLPSPSTFMETNRIYLLVLTRPFRILLSDKKS